MMTKKKIIAIIVSFLVIAAAFAAVWWMTRNIDELPEKPTSPTSVSIDHENGQYVLFRCNIYDIDRIRVTNSHGQYSVARNITKKVYIVEHDDVPLEYISSRTMYESAQSVYASLCIEKATKNPEWYGIDEPSAAVEIIMKDGTATRLNIGAAAPLGDGYYITVGDSNDVYLTSNAFAQRFLCDRTAYYDTVISAEADFATGFVNLHVVPADDEELYIRKATDDEAEQLRYYGGTVVEKPFLCGGTYTPVEELMNKLCFLKATGIVSDEINDDTLARYGLDDPTHVTITVKTDTTQIYSKKTGNMNPYYDAANKDGYVTVTSSYLIGSTEAQTTYVMFNGYPVIYAVNAADLAFLENTADVYCSDMLALQRLSDLVSLAVEYGGKEYFFDIKDSDTDDMRVTCGEYGEIDEDAFRNFYVTVLSVTRDGIADEPNGDDETVLKIVYGIRGGKKMTLEFIRVAERKCVMKVDGEGRFFVYRTKVDKIVEDMLTLLGK